MIIRFTAIGVLLFTVLYVFLIGIENHVDEIELRSSEWASENKCKAIETYFGVKKYKCADDSIHWKF